MGACSPWARVSDRPDSTKPVPSVATNEGSRSVTVRNPLSQPTPPPTTRIARIIPRMLGTP